MQTKLMRIEEDFFPSAGDAKPLGPPIPRGVPVQTIYSKRLGDAGFKTGADGKQSYTPGKAVVDAANGYVKPDITLSMGGDLRRTGCGRYVGTAVVFRATLPDWRSVEQREWAACWKFGGTPTSKEVL